MDRKQLTDTVREAFNALCSEKGEPPTIEELLAHTGGKTANVHALWRQFKAEFEGNKLASDSDLRTKLEPHFNRLVAAAVAEVDRRIHTLQSAQVTAMDAIARERDGLREQLNASQAAALDLQEQAKKLEFELQGARTEAAAAERISANLRDQLQEALRQAAVQAQESAAKDAEVARLQAQLRGQVEARLETFQAQMNDALAQIGAAARRRRTGPR